MGKCSCFFFLIKALKHLQQSAKPSQEGSFIHVIMNNRQSPSSERVKRHISFPSNMEMKLPCGIYYLD